MPKTLIIIPAHNEDQNIVQVVENIVKNFSQYDYVVINDGSSDRTVEICKECGYNCISLPVNLGVSAALQTGMQYAYARDYDFALQFDADGQHLPEYIPVLMMTMKQGYDIVIGSRYLEKRKKVTLRAIGSSIISFMIRLTTGKRITDPTSGMRLYNRKMICEFAYNTNYDPEPDTMAYLIRNNIAITEVQVEMEDRKYGKSFFNFANSVFYMIHITISILFVQWIRKREENHELTS